MDDSLVFLAGGEKENPEQSGRLRTPAVRPGDSTGNHPFASNYEVNPYKKPNFTFLEDMTSEQLWPQEPRKYLA